MIKSVLLVGFTALMAVSACKPEKKAPAEDVSKLTGLAKKGSAAAPVAPPNNLVVQKLQTNYWVFEHYLVPTGENAYTKKRENKGIWFQFHADGTYYAGQWGKTLDEGTYFIREEKNPYMGRIMQNVFLDSAIDDNRDVEWQIQGVSKEGGYMSWVKMVNNSVSQEPAMAKAIQMMNLPTPYALQVDSLGNPLPSNH
jgi:hypothetical protein